MSSTFSSRVQRSGSPRRRAALAAMVEIDHLHRRGQRRIARLEAAVVAARPAMDGEGRWASRASPARPGPGRGRRCRNRSRCRGSRRAWVLALHPYGSRAAPAGQDWPNRWEGNAWTKVVGVIGLGIMGGAMARNLKDAGWRVVGFDTDAARCAALAEAGIDDRDGCRRGGAGGAAAAVQPAEAGRAGRDRRGDRRRRPAAPHRRRDQHLHARGQAGGRGRAARRRATRCWTARSPAPARRR